MSRNRRIVITQMPDGPLSQHCFARSDADMPVPTDGQLLVRNLILSIDAANRAWMQGLTYRSALAEGTVMAGLALSEVIESRAEGFVPGDLIFADTGWQDYAAIDAAVAVRQPRTEPLSHLISAYGTSPLTAYFGLVEIAQLRAGETLLVSAAAGSVGNAVGQMARAMGARVIGVAGGTAKCRWLIDELGFDAAIDYKNEDLRDALKRTAPSGIDVYFDNVGGEILDRALFAMNEFGRVVCCGAISSYDGNKPVHGPRGVPGLVVTRRLTLRGLLVDDFADRFDEARGRIGDWVACGALRIVEDMIEGLDNAPAALIGQLAGQNRGKRMVRVA